MDMVEMVPEIDPITKRPLERPCRNAVCGHIYGMDSVQEALQTNARMRCPAIGCANKQHIRVEDLILDAELARKLQLQRAKKNRKNN